MTEALLRACYYQQPSCPSNEEWERMLPTKRFLISDEGYLNYLRYFSEKDVTLGSEEFQDLNILLPRLCQHDVDDTLYTYFLTLFFRLLDVKAQLDLAYIGQYTTLLPHLLQCQDNAMFQPIFDLFMYESRFLLPEEIPLFQEAISAISLVCGQQGFDDFWSDVIIPAARQYLDFLALSQVKLNFLLGLVEYGDLDMLQHYLQTRFPRLDRQDEERFYQDAIVHAVKRQNNNILEFLVETTFLPDDEIRRIIVASAVKYNISEWMQGYQEILTLDEISTCQPDVLFALPPEQRYLALDLNLCREDNLRRLLVETPPQQEIMDLIIMETARLGYYETLADLPIIDALDLLVDGAAMGGHIDLILWALQENPNLDISRVEKIARQHFNIATLLVVSHL